MQRHSDVWVRISHDLNKTFSEYSRQDTVINTECVYGDSRETRIKRDEVTLGYLLKANASSTNNQWNENQENYKLCEYGASTYWNSNV